MTAAIESPHRRPSVRSWSGPITGETSSVSVDEHIAAATYILAGLTGPRAVVTGVSAGFLWAQLRAARRDAQDVERRDRRQATMQFFADTLDIRRTMPLELPEDRDRQGIARLIERVRADSNDARRERSLLNEYLAWSELMASSINDEVQVFDPRLLELFASGRLIAVWTNYRPFIREERKRNRDPGLYEQLEIVSRRWSAGMPADGDHGGDRGVGSRRNSETVTAQRS